MLITQSHARVYGRARSPAKEYILRGRLFGFWLEGRLLVSGLEDTSTFNCGVCNMGRKEREESMEALYSPQNRGGT